MLNKINISPEQLTDNDLSNIVNNNSNNNSLLELFAISEQLKLKTMERIEFIKPIMEWNGYPLIYNKSIFIVQGAKGSHKSRLVETIVSAFLSTKVDIIGLSKNSNIEFFVIVLDSERNQSDQLPYSLQTIKIRAGYKISEYPDNLFATSFISIKRENRLEALVSIIEDLRSKHPNKPFFFVWMWHRILFHPSIVFMILWV